MAYEPIVLGSNITGMGALPPPPNYYTNPEVEERTAVVTNEDGTITVPKYQLAVNKPTFDLQNMQDLYGTKYMPMFRWIAQKQTGSVTFDPEEGLISDEEAERLSADFTSETGMSADEALREQYKQEGIAAVSQVAAGVGGQFGRSVASTVGAGDTFGLGNISEGISEGFTGFGFKDLFRAPSEGSRAKVLYGENSQSGNLATLKNEPYLQRDLSSFYDGKENALNKRIASQQEIVSAGVTTTGQQKLADEKLVNNARKEINRLEGFKSAPPQTLLNEIVDRGSYKTTAGKANIGGSIGAGVFTVAANLVSGNNLRESVQSGFKVGLGTYVGGLFGGFGALVGGLVGGRVICNELMRQGLLTRSEVLLDYRFTRDYLTPTHVNGYHVWAVWMVKQMRKGRFVGFWKHVAGHRANEIAYIYGDRDKPDYLGKVYRKVLEPICWSIGFFCKTTDWTVLYKKKEI